jgi:pimeloyl-ACP methyl ester carboxylesterase
MVEEYRAWARPWGFEPAQLQAEVVLWHGDDDKLVPPHWSRELAASIPNARLQPLPNEGHFLAYDHYADILRVLIS